MKLGRLCYNKKGEKFSTGMAVIAASILVSLIALWNGGSGIAGFAVHDSQNEEVRIIPSNLMQFDNVDSLTLAAGNYYIGGNGIVYWMDEESRAPIAKINFIEPEQKNRLVYIDDKGRVGYVLNRQT